MRRSFCLVIALGGVLLTGCPPSTPKLPETTDGGGWIVSTGYIGDGIISDAPVTTVTGTWQSDQSGAAGDPSEFVVTTDQSSLAIVQNGRVPATWTLVWNSSAVYPQCNGVGATGTPSYRGVVEEFNCIEVHGVVSADHDSTFQFTPYALNPANLPATATIQGAGFSSQYGMPLVQYFDTQGNLVDQTSASSVSSDGKTIYLATPTISELQSGIYVGVVNNIAADGSNTYLGITSLEVPQPFYLPTSYSDMAVSQPNYIWTQTSNPAGPTLGAFPFGYYTAAVQAYDDYEYDQNDNLNDVASQQGQCTWAGFPSLTSAQDLTLFVPYLVQNGGFTGSGGYYTVSAVIGSSSVTLYSGFIENGNGLWSAAVPAGTNLGSIQVTVSVSPANQNPGNPSYIYDTINLDMYVQ